MPFLLIALCARGRRVWAYVVSRRAQLPAEVRIVDPEGAPTIDADGAARSVQAAELTIPADALLELWSPETLERLARTYWRFLERSSLGLIRVRYCEHDRAVVLLCRPFVLIGFDPPEYELRRGPRPRALADPPRRARLATARPAAATCRSTCGALEGPPPGFQSIHVEVAVLSFYPAIANALSNRLYAATQSAIHVTRHARLPALARAARSRAVADRPLPRRRGWRRSSRGQSARSLARSWRAWMRRTVPERERITSDSVVAPVAPW